MLESPQVSAVLILDFKKIEKVQFTMFAIRQLNVLIAVENVANFLLISVFIIYVQI